MKPEWKDLKFSVAALTFLLGVTAASLFFGSPPKITVVLDPGYRSYSTQADNYFAVFSREFREQMQHFCEADVLDSQWTVLLTLKRAPDGGALINMTGSRAGEQAEHLLGTLLLGRLSFPGDPLEFAQEAAYGVIQLLMSLEAQEDTGPPAPKLRASFDAGAPNHGAPFCFNSWPSAVR